MLVRCQNVLLFSRVATFAPSLNVTWDESLIRLRFHDAGMLSTNSTPSPSSSSLAASGRVLEYRVFQRFMDEHEYNEMSFIDQLARFLMEVGCFLNKSGKVDL